MVDIIVERFWNRVR